MKSACGDISLPMAALCMLLVSSFVRESQTVLGASAFTFSGIPLRFPAGKEHAIRWLLDRLGSLLGSHCSLSPSRTVSYDRKMTTVYMTSTMGKAPAFAKKLGTLPNEPNVQALVPFGGSAQSVSKPDKQILGGKGLGLQEMSSIGIDVPPGFTLTTPVCQIYQKTDDLPEELWQEVRAAIGRVEKDMGRKFGDANNPLLFSCRSGAAISMPGMMDTVLNVVR